MEHGVKTATKPATVKTVLGVTTYMETVNVGRDLSEKDVTCSVLLGG